MGDWSGNWERSDWGVDRIVEEMNQAKSCRALQATVTTLDFILNVMDPKIYMEP